MKHVNATPREVRKFGILVSVVFLLLAAFSLYKETALWKWMLCGSVFFLITGLFVYHILKPIYIGWMTFAVALGWLNTRIILGLTFFLIFTPVALFFRLIRKDVLGLQFDKEALTYWVKPEPKSLEMKRYEQLF